jgi:transcriptional regulator with XRE-family HTH domain
VKRCAPKCDAARTFRYLDSAIRLANLENGRNAVLHITDMASKTPHSNLRTHRRRSGLTQRELAGILGCISKDQVSRHERGKNIPPLPVALGYEIVFGVPVSQIFPGVRSSLARAIETHLDDMEQALQQKSAKNRRANAIARKLEWICERRNPIEI